MRLPIFRDQADAGAHRVVRLIDSHRRERIAREYPTVIRTVGPVDGAERLGPSGTDQPRQTEDLPSAHLERHAAHPLAGAEILHAERHRADCATGTWAG